MNQVSKALLIVIFFSFSFLSNGQELEEDYKVNFIISKQHLVKRELLKALPYLHYLHQVYPDNHNIGYLIGLCYVELEIINKKSIELLSSATAMASLDYDPSLLEEERVPIYVFYYLALAYAQNGFCEKAEIARTEFLELYPYEDQFYVDDSKLKLQNCISDKPIHKFDTLPEFRNFVPYSSEKNIVNIEEDIIADSAVVDKSKLINEKSEVRKVITKFIEYSTEFPVFAVQLGAFNEIVPVSRFKELKNIDAFIDHEGLIRYVMGHFSIQSQAKSLLEAVHEKGYSDAFIVNVNDSKKFSDEVISVNNINLKANLAERVEYRVQIGAFSKRIPFKTAQYYFEIDGIKEHYENQMTYLTVGKYKTYQEARAFQHLISNDGIKDAFVVAFNNGKKISLNELNEFK
jgi:hypothetical protein